MLQILAAAGMFLLIGLVLYVWTSAYGLPGWVGWPIAALIGFGTPMRRAS